MRVGYTFGVFDMFHIGHLNLLRRAKLECDYLFVGVLSDAAANELRARPVVMPFADRLAIIRSMRAVDAAIGVETTNPAQAWDRLRFDVLFLGSHHGASPVGAEKASELTDLGVEVIVLPHTQTTSSILVREGFSTDSEGFAGRPPRGHDS